MCVKSVTSSSTATVQTSDQQVGVRQKPPVLPDVQATCTVCRQRCQIQKSFFRQKENQSATVAVYEHYNTSRPCQALRLLCESLVLPDADASLQTEGVAQGAV